MSNESTLAPRHGVSMTDCSSLSVSGVKEVISFDEASVSLVTTCGILNVEGNGLHIAALDLVKGVTEITGQVDGLYYSKAKEKGVGFFRRGK